MKILHLSHTDISSDSRILKEMHSIRKIDNFYKIIGIGLSIDNTSIDSKEIDGLHIQRIYLFTKKWKMLPKRVRQLFSFFELLIKMTKFGIKEKPSVVHCNDTVVLPVGVLIKFVCKSKLIYDAHELESKRNGVGAFFGKLILLVEKMCWRFIDALIVVSPSIKKWYKKNIGSKKTEVILNAPIFNEDKKNENSYLRNKFNIPEDSKIFLYIGEFGQGRGIELLLNSFKSKDISSHLVFLGFGSLGDEIAKASKEHSNIHLHDAVPHEDVVSIAKSADVGLCLVENVSLSDYYCLPNKLFEYAFSNIPVLASNFPDMSKVVKEHDLGFCTDLDAKSVVKGIKDFEISDKKFKMKNLYELSWEAQEEKLIKLYKEVLENIKG